jgi:hypothetical protein
MQETTTDKKNINVSSKRKKVEKKTDRKDR